MKNKSLDNCDFGAASKDGAYYWGNPNAWELICKAWNEKEGWMKSTKAMEIEGVGCLVQVTTHQKNDNGGTSTAPTNNIDAVAEALTFVPGTKIIRELNDMGEVYNRRIVSMNIPPVNTGPK